MIYKKIYFIEILAGLGAIIAMATQVTWINEGKGRVHTKWRNAQSAIHKRLVKTEFKGL